MATSAPEERQPGETAARYAERRKDEKSLAWIARYTSVEVAPQRADSPTPKAKARKRIRGAT